jgi:hypothetical protein
MNTGSGLITDDLADVGGYTGVNGFEFAAHVALSWWSVPGRAPAY